MITRILTIVFVSLFCVSLSGQHHHWCGTDHEANVLRLKKHNETLQNHENWPERMTRYIPIKFHMIADDNGASRVSYQGVFKQLCKLRKDFEPLGFIPYMSGDLNLVDHTGINNTPMTNSSSWIMNGLKDPEAVNIFIVKSADDGSGLGTILGYYDPSFDFIVIRTAEVIDSTASLTHELGHFLSLDHPFFGWENMPYDANEHGNPITQNTINGYPIELVDGSNCLNSGDQICDTPPDYLFSFSNSVSVNNCNMTTQVFDRNVDLIEPMEDNIMSYFECDDYRFTDDQVQMMELDFDSGARAYIRTGYVPNDNPITEDIEILNPPVGEDVEVFNSILFDWNDVEHADMYYVNIKDVFGGTEQEFFIEESELLVTNLTADSKILWFVQAFNEAWGCTKSDNISFDTGITSSVAETLTSTEAFEVFPNPSGTNQTVNVFIESSKQQLVSLEVLDITGKLVQHMPAFPLEEGTKQIKIEDLNNAGVYFFRLSSKEGSITRKLIKN